jgi:hypothetical protein
MMKGQRMKRGTRTAHLAVASHLAADLVAAHGADHTAAKRTQEAALAVLAILLRPVVEVVALVLLVLLRGLPIALLSLGRVLLVLWRLSIALLPLGRVLLLLLGSAIV